MSLHGSQGRICLPVSIVAAGFAVARYCCAQQADTLEEILVTAQKRSEPVEAVPISISAFTGDYLEQSGAITVEDVSRMVPDFTVGRGSQQVNTILSIRGIGSTGNSAIESSVGAFIDGVYYPRPAAIIGLLPDLATFEVLRGPQGTLFGRNAVAGALNITTREPARANGAMVEAGYGDFGRIDLGGTVNARLGDAAAGNLAIRYLDRNGYGVNLLDDRRVGALSNFVARARLRLDLSERLAVLVTADHAAMHTGGELLEVLNATDVPAFDATLTALYGSTATTADSFDRRLNQDHRDRFRDEQNGVSVDMRFTRHDGVRLRSLSAYRDWDADVYESVLRIPADLLPRYSHFRTRTLSEELQLLSPGGAALEWVGGVFLYREDYDIDQGFDAGHQFCVPTVRALLGPAQAQQCLAFAQYRIVDAHFRQNLSSVAAFAQGTWHLAERWSATAGVRWTRDRKDADLAQAINNPFATLIRVAEVTPDLRRRDARATWFANLRWYPEAGVMLFATASTGYKSGGFNPEGASEALGRDRRTFGPEQATNLELGMKSTLLSGRATLDVTAYRLDLSDFQDRAFDGVSLQVFNVGKVRQQGFEADARWRPAPPLRVSVGASYLDSAYLRFPDAPPLPGDSQPQDLRGERKTSSPRWQITAAADWTGRLAGSIEWFAGGSWQFTDSQNIGLVSNNNPQSVQPAYALLNARAGVRQSSGKWELTLFGNNLANRGYCLAIGDQPLGATLGAVDAARHAMVQRCVLGAPRTWNLRLRRRFGAN
jgi:iron complex outermembrane receptor protein